MEETQTLDNNFQEEQQNPPKKYSVKDFATKIRQKYKAYNDVDDDKLVKFFIKKYPVYQDKIEFSQVPIVKKKEDTPSQPLATPSPLPLQKDGGKYVLTDYLTNPKAQEQKEDISIVEPKEEPLSIGNVFDDAALSFSLRNTTKEISNTDLRNNAPITVLVPDEEAIAKSKKIDKEYLENGIDPQKVAKLTHGLNFTQEQKDELDYVAKTNPAYFNRHLHHISWTVPFMQEMHKRREEAKLENDPQKAAQIEKAVSDIYKNGQILPYEQSRDVTRNALRGIRTIFDNPEEQQNKFAENAEYNYGQQLIPIKKDGVWYEPNAELNRGKDVAKMFDSGINDVQRIGLNYLEDLHPEQYQSYKGLLVPYKDGDEKNIDLQVGRQEKLMRLEALGLNIKYKAALEEFYKARERGDVESQNTYKEVLDNTQKFSENLIEKYPLVKQLDVEKLAMEVNGRDDLPTTRFAYVLGSAIDKTLKGGWEIISYPFRSEENYQKHLLEVVGDTKQNENITYLPQKYQTIQNFDTEQTEEAKVKFAEINKQDISDEEKNKQIADYIAQNKDAVTRKEIDGGRTNITMASMLYGVSDIAANLAPFVAITALTGGGASASALRAFTSEFSAASLTMFNDELSAASERGEANPMANALRHTFINSAAMAGAGTAGKIREMAMGSKNPAFKKMIEEMSDEAIEAAIKKETLSKFQKVFEIAKNKMVQSASSAAKITPAIQAGSITNDLMDGKEINAAEQAKHLGVETFKFTIFGFLTGGFGAMANREKVNDIQRYSIFEAGKNYDYFAKDIDTQLENGKISPEQHSQLKANVELAKKVYDNTPMVDANGKALSDSRARDLMFTKFNEVRAAELLKKDIPPTTGEVGKDKVGDNSDLISITHEATDAVAKELGLPEYTEKPETIAEWDAEVNNRLSENPNAIQEMLDKYRNKGKIDKYDQRMMLKYHAALKDRINKNPTSENIKQYNEAKILSDIEGGREVAKSLVARKGVIPVEDDLANFLVQEANSAGVETLPQKVIDELKTKYEADQKVIKDLNARIEKLEQEAADKELTAQAKKTGKTKKTSSDFKEQRKSLKDKLKQQLEDYKNEIGKVGIAYDGGVKSFAITVDMAKTIGEYIKTYLEEGVTKLSDVVAKLHEEIKDVMPDISERDIRDVIAGKYAEKKQTRNDIAAQMRDIKMQQIVLDKIEKLEKGETIEKNPIKKQKISEELEKLKEQFKNMGGEKPTDEQKLQSLKTGLKNKIEKLKKDLETGDFMKEPEQKKPLKLDAEAQKLQDEHIRFVKETNLRRAKAEFNNRSKGEKVYDGIMQVLGIKRIVQTAIDLSIPFRQAVTIAFNPRRWDTFGKSFGNMMKSVFSSKKFDRIMYEIHQSKDYQDMLKDKVHFNEMDAVDSNSRNEDFQKSFIYKIPILREPLLASNRAADGFLNTARYDMYMKGKKMLERQGITRDNAPEHYEALGKWVMNITGRGNLIKFLEDSHSGRMIASNTFFGARLMASRFNLLNPVYYSKMPKEVRIEALKDMATFTSMLFATGLAATAAGATVSFDPDDADFLKIKNGNTRYDISGGMVQYVRTFIRLEKMIAQRINHNISKKEKDKYASYALKSTASFFRYKLAPNTSYGFNALEGKDALGKDFDPYDALKIYPMYVDDMVTAYKESGAMSFLTVGLPSIFGVGVQTYEPKKSSKKFPLNR